MTQLGERLRPRFSVDEINQTYSPSQLILNILSTSRPANNDVEAREYFNGENKKYAVTG